jgi:hypothetical protein
VLSAPTIRASALSGDCLKKADGEFLAKVSEQFFKLYTCGLCGSKYFGSESIFQNFER